MIVFGNSRYCLAKVTPKVSKVSKVVQTKTLRACAQESYFFLTTLGTLDTLGITLESISGYK